jgi:hypothetical protein
MGCGVWGGFGSAWVARAAGGGDAVQGGRCARLALEEIRQMKQRRQPSARVPAGAPAPIDSGGSLRPVRGVVSARPGDGVFEHRRMAPHAALGDLIEHYWFVRWSRGGLPGHTAQTLPHPCVHWTFEAHTGAGTITGVHTRMWQRDLGSAGDQVPARGIPAVVRAFAAWPAQAGAAGGGGAEGAGRGVLAVGEGPACRSASAGVCFTSV